MNLKLLAGFSVVACAVAFAQDGFYAESAAEPAASVPAAAPVAESAPVAAAPVAPASASSAVFDGLRGSAYNTVGNEAAASNINDYLARPHNFGGTQLLYVEPAVERGLVSFGEKTTFFGMFDNSEDLGRLTAGIAMKDSWGLSLNLALGQFHQSQDGGSTGITEAGDDWGAKFSMALGSYALAASVDWLTTAEEQSADPDNGKASDENYDSLTINVNINNASGSIAWTLGADIIRHSSYTSVGSVTTDENADSYTKFAPYFNLGTKVLSNERARVFVGSNNALPVVFFDGYDSTSALGDVAPKKDESLFEIGLSLEPNILGELSLTDNVLLFGEASYTWLLFGFGSGTDDSAVDYTVLQSKSNTASATVGFRYQKDNRYAAEFALGDDFFTGTNAIFNGRGVFISFGGFLYF
ncbi:MAG: hypothetical protein WCR04_11105 [Fibrobacteraceae bacterium]